MDQKQIPKKYQLTIKRLINKHTIKHEFVSEIEGALENSESWEDFQSDLYDSLQDYVRDVLYIQNILCRG
jgi:hypothetical protein